MKDKHLNDGASTQYSISEAAQASGLTAKAIRYYEQIEMITKALRRTLAITFKVCFYVYLI